MSNLPAHEFAALVRDAKIFIQNQLGSLPKPFTQVRERPAPPQPKPALPSQEIPEKVPTVAKPKVESSPPTLKTGNWELQAMLPVTPPSEFRKKLALHTPVLDMPCDVLLVLPEENSLHRLFLENVSRAVTRSFASSVVVLYHEDLWQQVTCKCILAPLTLLQARFPKGQAHVPIRESKISWIPLDHLDIYAHDVNHKRALWMSIQRTFQS